MESKPVREPCDCADANNREEVDDDEEEDGAMAGLRGELNVKGSEEDEDEEDDDTD
jgi:hypothetical protein